MGSETVLHGHKNMNYSLKWDQIRDGFIYLKKTKTMNPRQIPINDTRQALFDHIRKHGEKSTVVDMKSKISKIKKNPVYVFTFNGEPVMDIHKGFTQAVEGAGIRDLKFHDPRHRFASHLVMNGATIKDVMELLGHKDTKMTNRYAHLSPEHKQKAVSLLNRLTAKTGMSDFGRFSESAKNPIPANCLNLLEPPCGVEPQTSSLRVRCSTS